MPTNSSQPARGTRDFLPPDVRRREYVIGIVRDVYARYGFEPLETPAFENIETLTGKYGEEGNRLIFKILKRGEHESTGEADLALRYDLTVPLARVVAQYQNELPRFFKRYQIQPVWRADRPARGRFREFFQCDLDTVGTTSPLVEAEQMAAVGEIMTRLGFEDFTIRVNHRAILSLLLTKATLPPSQHADALVALDKLDKIGRDGVSRELADKGISEHGRDTLLNWIGAGPRPDRLDWLERELDAAEHPAFLNLRQILDLAGRTPAGARLRFDPSLARGLSYYTGAIMEIAVPDLAGSLGGGGRYDNLIGMFLGRDLPACGFSLGLERVIVVMMERQMFPERVVRGGLDMMVTIWSHDRREESLALAAELRNAGLRVELYPEADKLGKQFKYASARQVPFVAIVGDDERARGEVAVKDMRSGEQVAVSRADAAAFIKGKVRSDS